MLVDMDLSKRIFDEVLVEWESYAFNVEVVYERMPMFCTHCRIIGHNVSYCKWLHPTDNEQVDHVKRISEVEAPKKGKQQWADHGRNTHVGTSGVATTGAVERTLVPQQVLEENHEVSKELPDRHVGHKVFRSDEEYVNTNETETVHGKPKQIANSKASTSFHFPLVNVTDEVVPNHIDTLRMAQQTESNSPTLELVQPLVSAEVASPGISTATITSPTREVVPETQKVQQTNICLVLQKDFNLIRHIILVKDTDNSNAPFTPYLTKKQKKEINRTYKTRSKGDVSPPNQ